MWRERERERGPGRKGKESEQRTRGETGWWKQGERER